MGEGVVAWCSGKMHGGRRRKSQHPFRCCVSWAGSAQGPAGVQDGVWGLTPAVSLSGLESLPIVVFNEVTTFERLY